MPKGHRPVQYVVSDSTMDVQGVVEQDYEVLKVYRSGDIYVYKEWQITSQHTQMHKSPHAL